MPEKYYQRKADEDGCVYIFDYKKKKWQKYCDVEAENIPASVRKGVKEDMKKEQAELALLKSIEL